VSHPDLRLRVDSPKVFVQITQPPHEFPAGTLNTLWWFSNRASGSDQISVIFDMKDTGWSNMDMDFIRYLITLLKQYYPYFVNYLMIFEMPWLLKCKYFTGGFNYKSSFNEIHLTNPRSGLEYYQGLVTTQVC